jgi:CBS domain-containing protein
MKEYRVSHLPVIENERVIGLVYIRDIVFELIEHLPRGRATVAQVAKRAPKVSSDSTVAEAASEMVMADCEAVFVDSSLLTDTDVVRASAYGDPYAEKASQYSINRIITTDSKSDLECAVRLMKANNVGKLVVWKDKIVSVKDIGYLIPEIVKRLTKYVVLIKGEIPNVKGVEIVRTVGDFDAIAIVEGDEELFKLVDKLRGNELKILVGRP